MKELEYPFDPELLLKRSKRIKRELTEDGSERIRKKRETDDRQRKSSGGRFL